ncbi:MULTISPECIES: hypothetical protein [unclassified Mameliella]|uniref:hypothetical protein n=1 Tax=unclassified Mameliella TaxID=2630630 RepID=UPI00273D6152|nr:MULTISPECIES: hypothetical protein [unclassified Mameliella]
MERFTEDETKRLDEILAVEVNPFLKGGRATFGLPLGGATQRWLFTTHMNLPAEAQKELEYVLSDEVDARVRVWELNNYLEQNQINSAPEWWELGFFEFDRTKFWKFLVEQCRKHFSDDYMRQSFDSCVERIAALNEAIHVLRVHEANPSFHSEKKVAHALAVFDASYPLDFSDYEEVPQRARDPYSQLQQFIGHELSNLEAVFSKRWFEFKLLDELATFEHYFQDGQRNSETSKKICTQLRGYMFRQALAFGRMVEHYRWKFSFEGAALEGIKSAEVAKIRGKKGGQASGRNRQENLKVFMSEIEALSDTFPRMSEEAIFAQAYANAAAKRKMPRSRKVIDSYGDAIRSEQPFKARFDAIFRKIA